MQRETSIRSGPSVLAFAHTKRKIYNYVTHIVNTKIIESLGNFNLLLCIKPGIGKLFTLAESAFDNLEVADIAQEVADGLVWIRSVSVGV
jgi:hypothetical protein